MSEQESAIMDLAVRRDAVRAESHDAGKKAIVGSFAGLVSVGADIYYNSADVVPVLGAAPKVATVVSVLYTIYEFGRMVTRGDEAQSYSAQIADLEAAAPVLPLHPETE